MTTFHVNYKKMLNRNAPFFSSVWNERLEIFAINKFIEKNKTKTTGLDNYWRHWSKKIHLSKRTISCRFTLHFHQQVSCFRFHLYEKYWEKWGIAVFTSQYSPAGILHSNTVVINRINYVGINLEAKDVRHSVTKKLKDIWRNEKNLLLQIPEHPCNSVVNEMLFPPSSEIKSSISAQSGMINNKSFHKRNS